MTSFVDASVIVAILGGEADAMEQAARLSRTDDLCTSPLAVWEAVTALVRRHGLSPSDARREVEDTLAAGRVRLVAIGASEGDMALKAFERYGKGIDRAALNFGDCFAYACAKTNHAELLYKGNDFANTDLA